MIFFPPAVCRQELDGLVERSQGRFQLHHALSAPPADWPETYTKGRMTENTLRQYLPPPSDDALLMVCGPDGLINEIVKPGLVSQLNKASPSRLDVD